MACAWRSGRFEQVSKTAQPSKFSPNGLADARPQQGPPVLASMRRPVALGGKGECESC